MESDIAHKGGSTKNSTKAASEGERKNLVDLLAMPQAAEIRFEPVRFGDNLLVALEKELLATARAEKIELRLSEIRTKGLVAALFEKAERR